MKQSGALRILKTGANVFLTGEPGSGKTHTVNTYVAWLREQGVEPAITASTGIAATHIGGQTIHSWSGIGVREQLRPYDLDAIAQNKGVVERVGKAGVLIIDEVSMLSASVLDMVEMVCRAVRRNTLSFGGLQVIFVGDFFQLPPVVSRKEKEHEDMLFDEPLQGNFAFQSSAWERARPIVCYLAEQHRQEDATFLKLLAGVRQGEVSDDHRATLFARRVLKAKRGVTHLYAHNADVDRLNAAELSKLPGEVRSFAMTGRGPEKILAGLKRGCLSPERLELKVGAKVMFTKNDPGTRKYVNGTQGVVMSFNEAGLPVVRTTLGRVLVAEPQEWRLEDSGRVLASIEQVPLRLAWAVTVHKSQGMSLDEAHMDLSNAFEYGQGYVALSRVRSLKGLSLAGLNERALEVHPEVLERDAGFRDESDAADAAFAALPQKELQAMEENFVRALGGKPPVHKKTPRA